MDTLAPRDEKDIIDVVKVAIANAEPLAIVGGGTRSGLGRPVALPRRISTVALDGIIAYEPSELVLTAKAGTPLKAITDLLAQNAQELAFEPIDHSRLYGAAVGTATIGGAVSVNASGPRRIKAGAARDHLLGFRAVNGRGEAFQSGGRVMKNVTGYDMCKLMSGSFGTLGILAELSIKVLPKAETQATLAISGLSDAQAVDVMTFVSGLPQDVSGLAHLPAPYAAFRSPAPAGLDQAPVTLFRVEGPEVSVNQRLADLKPLVVRHLGDIGWTTAAPPEVIGDLISETLWGAIRDANAFAGTDDQIWRISTAPTNGAAVVTAATRAGLPLNGHFYDWAGGLVWLAVTPAGDGHSETIRSFVADTGGHATLVRAADAVRSDVPVFHPQPEVLAALSARVKRGFDPELILNRGRMRDDI